MSHHYTGGCHCGAIRYEITSRPIAMLICHCRDCQQIGGGAYTPVVYLPAKAFRITKGALSHYSTQSERGGENKRGFCAGCGSRVTGAESERGIGVTASSLDDPILFKPSMHLWVCDAQPWDLLDSDLPKHDKYPPAK
jgi:hypothetical protein